MHPLSKWASIYKHQLAKIVISYCAYPGTSNNEHIQYKIMDNVVFDQNIDSYYTEHILCMKNGFHVYKPSHTFPEIKPIEHDTFNMCCFNNPIKITHDMINLWKQLLTEIPGSCLYLGYHYYSSEFIKSKWCSLFNEYNVKFIHEDKIEDMLNHYNKMDIALDTYPYNGTTISCEALRMNVPVVTLKGKYPHSRIGASLLETVMCSDLIAETKVEYVSTVISLSKNRTIKNKLKDNIQQLSDIDGFMKQYEHLLLNLKSYEII